MCSRIRGSKITSSLDIDLDAQLAFVDAGPSQIGTSGALRRHARLAADGGRLGSRATPAERRRLLGLLAGAGLAAEARAAAGRWRSRHSFSLASRLAFESAREIGIGGLGLLRADVHRLPAAQGRLTLLGRPGAERRAGETQRRRDKPNRFIVTSVPDHTACRGRQAAVALREKTEAP